MLYVFTPQTFYIAQGDLGPALDYLPMDGNGDPVPVAPGDSVVFSMRPQGGGDPIISRAAAQVVDAEPPYFRYSWAGGDTDLAGQFVGEFEWLNAGLPETFPNHDTAELWVLIRDDIA